eukprot:gene32380-39971_t
MFQAFSKNDKGDVLTLLSSDVQVPTRDCNTMWALLERAASAEWFSYFAACRVYSRANDWGTRFSLAPYPNLTRNRPSCIDSLSRGSWKDDQSWTSVSTNRHCAKYADNSARAPLMRLFSIRAMIRIMGIRHLATIVSRRYGRTC